MGLVYTDIEIINSDDLALHRKGYIDKEKIKKIKVKALVDSGAYMMGINESVRIQLDLQQVDEKLAEYANGHTEKLAVVGPIEIRFENRKTVCFAMVLPGDSEVLLGSIPMEDMDVLIDPKTQRLIVNPQTPYIPKMSMKKTK